MNKDQKTVLTTIGLTLLFVIAVILLFVLKNKPFEFIYQRF